MLRPLKTVSIPIHLSRLSASHNVLVVLVRKYLDFTSYWITLFVVMANTGVMLVLAKHLWRAWWIQDKADAKPVPSNKSSSADKKGSVSIDMGEEAAAALQHCMDDNFLIEVILAAFDFFRVSETKQD